MNDERLVAQIKRVLDQEADKLCEDRMVSARLRVARQEALDRISESRSAWWSLPAVGAATATALLVAVLITLPEWFGKGFDVGTQQLQPGDIEMLSTMELEEIEALDFYYWLESENGSA